MGNSAVVAAPMEGVFASMAALNALFLEEEALANCLAAGADGGDGTDLLGRLYRIRLERLGLEKRLEAQVAALTARDAAQSLDLQQAMTPPDASTHDRTYAEISAVEEIAGILTVSSGAAGAFLSQARRVCSLPSVYGALSTGSLSWQGARIIADETEALDHPAAVALADHFLDPDAPNPARGCPATGLVPSRLRAKVRAWRERHHPDSIEKRHAKGIADRRVEFTRDRDGMAWIAAYLPADTATGIWNRARATARGLQGPHEARTLSQLTADVVATRLLTPAHAITTGDGSSQPRPSDQDQRVAGEQLPDEFLGLATLVGSDEPAADLNADDQACTDSIGIDGAGLHGAHAATSPDAGKVPTPRADVIVTVPVFALLGHTDEPANLDGYGPIPFSMARKLLADGADSFTRVLIDPLDGTPLEIGRTSYRITKAMRKALTLRDGKCTFPGCNNNALDNEADHLTAWEHGGTTGISNLAQLCPKHHRLKHNSGWTPTQATKNQPPGWTSPTGRTYPAEQPDREPTIWPDNVLLQELNTVPHLPKPPWEEPEDDNLIDADDIAPYDPVWDDFYAMPIVLPPDPQKDQILSGWIMNDRASGIPTMLHT